MNNIIKLHNFKETDRHKSVKETLRDFNKFCEEEKADGIICIAYRKDFKKELIASFASYLRFTEKMGMLKEAEFKFSKED